MTAPASSQHSIAPAQLWRGPGVWQQGLADIKKISSKPLLLGRSQNTRTLRGKLAQDLTNNGFTVESAELKFDCCEIDLAALELKIQQARCDGVIASGGGKVLDAGKLLADRLDLPCITVPTSAATCAGWTALANIYSPDGAFQADVSLKRCPQLLIFDHQLVLTAPARTLASGIADAMAKWYEASVSSGQSRDGLVQQAVQQARVLRDQLLIEGVAALQDPG
ncbi:MAG: iron-containing alcohol dehydrogenase, partial [Synechococcaceae bacterium WB6_1B_055]|nr:iron-containing alcohol dehydrogenase [Synechococcaceae bacterium WB6_1B_055]